MRTERLRRQSVRTMVQQSLGSAGDETPTREASTIPVVTSPTTTTATPSPGAPAPVIQTRPAQPAKTPPPLTRSKLGWSIRNDLIKACKQMALDEHLHDYEVLERLLEEALARRSQAR